MWKKRCLKRQNGMKSGHQGSNSVRSFKVPNQIADILCSQSDVIEITSFWAEKK